ncbi:unnamed protein product, partial [marine sediment metagenome]
CTNELCESKLLEKLKHFVKVVDIPDVGEKILERLYESEMVLYGLDLYTLGVGDLMGLSRVGRPLAEKLVKNINTRREISLAKFLESIGIRCLGSVTSLAVAHKF